MNLPKLTVKEIFGHRFRKTLLIYFPLNFFSVIFLIWFTHKISSYKVPESFVLKVLVDNLYIILPWAYLFSHTLYSYFDAPPKTSSSETDEDIELGPVAPPPNPPAPVSPPPERPPTPQNSLPDEDEFVDVDLGEGPSNWASRSST